MILDLDSIVLERPMCDWLTLTSWIYAPLNEIFANACGGDEVIEQVKRMQYTGRLSPHCYLGSGEIKGKVNNMLQATGFMGDVVLMGMPELCDVCNCRRIDLQITIDSKITMFDIAARMNKRKRTVGFRESKGLATVYIGSFSSDKLIRIYQKKAGVVRFEVMYKGYKSGPIMHALIASGNPRNLMGDYLKYELLALNDTIVEGQFAPVLAARTATKTPKVVRADKATEKWLQDVVMPVLFKYANAHDSNEDLLYWLSEAIKGNERDETQSGILME